MSYRLYWLVEPYVLVNESYDVLTQAELTDFIEQSLKVIQSVDHPVHFIADGNNVHQFTVSLVGLQKLLRPFNNHPNVGWLITLNKTPVERMIAGIAVQFLRSKARAFGSLQDALVFLMSMDDKIPRVDAMEAIRLSADSPVIASAKPEQNTP